MKPAARIVSVCAVSVAAVALGAAHAVAQPQPQTRNAQGDKKPDFPPFEKVIEGFEQVISTADGQSLYDVYVDKKEGKVLAALPRDFERHDYFLAPTYAEGVPGAQSSAMDGYLVKWKRIGKRLVLIQPNLETRSTGSPESKRSVESQFTDRVVTDVPIVTMGPKGGPVISLSDMLVAGANKLFPFFPRLDARLTQIAKAKAFPENIELAFTVPVIPTGNLVTIHYSWSALPQNTGYKPQEADYRVGFFVTPFDDLNKIGDPSIRERYINRWKLEKADPSLKLSPPKEPIVFFIEHTTPIEYRQAVREGILAWNKAFEQVGIVNAVEVYQQDSRTGAHMEKDPEDVRYNFARWASNGAGFAIGPLRADPRTGQILDADILMNDGWIRGAVTRWEKVMSEMAIETLTPETLAWLDENPQWDPRILFHNPAERARLIQEREQMLETTGPRAHGGHPVAEAYELREQSRVKGGLWSSAAQTIYAAMCSLPTQRAMDMDMASLGLLDLEHLGSNGGDIDEVPDEFVNALIKDVIMHEIGHVMGLRHNFVASTIYPIEKINSEDMKGKAFTGSVMDYNAANYHLDLGQTQGEYFMPALGPYDIWAIRFGYGDEKEREAALAQATDPAHVYHSDEHLFSADPRVRQRDMGANVLDFVESELRFIQDRREKILDKVVEEGDSWERVRQAYLSLLSQQFRNVQTAANWVGSAVITRDRVGEAERDPVTPVDVKDQRRALQLAIDQSFYEESFSLTPELIRKMTTERNFDEGFARAFGAEELWTIHDTILGIQNTTMTLLMNPTTLRRVLDNEFLVDSGKDALTLAEMMGAITDHAWSELDNVGAGRYTARKPLISSLRRNLQRTHLERLINLTMPNAIPGAAAKPVATLAAHTLRKLDNKIALVLDGGDSRLDPYTTAHLEDARTRIAQALDAMYVYNN